MKLPEITSDHPERDAQICAMYVNDLMSMEDIGLKLDLTKGRICQILTENEDYTLELLKRKYSKAKRATWIARQIEKRGPSKKDAADLMEQFERTLEGTGKQQGQGGLTIQIVNFEGKQDTDTCVEVHRFDTQAPA